MLQEEILGKNHAEDPKQVKKRKLKEKIDRWRAKALHGQIIRLTEQINTQISTLVLRKMSAGYKLARIFSQDIKMSFGLDKCAVLEMRRGRQVGSSGIELPDDQHIGAIEEEGYKYLGILQLDQTLNTKMKGKITSEYIKRVKTLCRSKLNGGN